MPALLDGYLSRLGAVRPPSLDEAVLARLHVAHLERVPFENLDIALGRPLALDIESLYDKIVRRRRGGFCYELNGLFAWLLEGLGFEVERLEARVWSDGRPGPEFDHLALRVIVDRRPWLADVGFGDSFVEPLPWSGPEVEQRGTRYRLRESGGRTLLERRADGGEWRPQYDLSGVPRELSDFEPMCRYQQTSPESIFTRKAVCTRLTTDGRLTWANGRRISTRGGERAERPVREPSHLAEVLRDDFGVELAAAEVELLSRFRPPPDPGIAIDLGDPVS